MFGIGFGEMLIIAVILLIAVGPKQLPSLMKTVGKGMRDVRRAAEDLRRSTGIDELMRDEDLRNPLREPPPRSLTAAELERETPREGVDVDQARVAAERAATVQAAEQAARTQSANEPGHG
jgi:sec-independent protein translocase protein TatB